MQKFEEYKCPSWDDFPDIYLYMDQAISVLDKYLSPFYDEKSITSTMINNYVKQKIVSAPQNKKYSREQIARIFMICILKRFMQLSDISVLLDELEKDRSIEEAFAIFKSEFDYSMKLVFSKTKIQSTDASAEIIVLRNALIAFAAICKASEEFVAYFS